MFKLNHHKKHFSSVGGFIEEPTGQSKASANSGLFTKGPITLQIEY